MNRYAIVKNGIVENIIISDPDNISRFEEAYSLSDTDVVDIGWLSNGGIFSIPTAPPESIESATIRVRTDRNNLLTTVVDPYVMNSLRWADLTTEQQTEIAEYRRALLDITDQVGFPFDVIWPTRPYFM